MTTTSVCEMWSATETAPSLSGNLVNASILLNELQGCPDELAAGSFHDKGRATTPGLCRDWYWFQSESRLCAGAILDLAAVLDRHFLGGRAALGADGFHLLDHVHAVDD